MRNLTPFSRCLLLSLTVLLLLQPAYAATNEERLKSLQQKLQELQQQLTQLKEQQEQGPSSQVFPWQPIQELGQESPGYKQYIYLLAPQLEREAIEPLLQQMDFYASRQDSETSPGLFVVPWLSAEGEESLSADGYNTELAKRILAKIGSSSTKTGILVTPAPLGGKGIAEGPQLFVELHGCKQELRGRIFVQLQEFPAFDAGNSLSSYLWALLQQTAPEEFGVSLEGARLRLRCGGG